MGEGVETLKEQVLLHIKPFMGQIDILSSIKRVSVFIAIAIFADITEALFVSVNPTAEPCVERCLKLRRWYDRIVRIQEFFIVLFSLMDLFQ
jgi:hypothetical protein